jgi:hypothetical protein
MKRGKWQTLLPYGLAKEPFAIRPEEELKCNERAKLLHWIVQRAKGRGFRPPTNISR